MHHLRPLYHETLTITDGGVPAASVSPPHKLTARVCVAPPTSVDLIFLLSSRLYECGVQAPNKRLPSCLSGCVTREEYHTRSDDSKTVFYLECHLGSLPPMRVRCICVGADPQTREFAEKLKKYDIQLASNQFEYSLVNQDRAYDGTLAECKKLGEIHRRSASWRTCRP